MKLVIFSPMTTTSAIGRVSGLIAKALVARGHAVTVVRTESEAYLHSACIPCGVPVLKWNDTDAVAAVINEASQLVYQIGDNFPYHCGALHWLEIAPGIVCLHDFFVANLFEQWSRGRRSEAERVLAQWYGDEAATDFFSASNSQAFFEKAARSYPMTEWICAMAYCVVSHSRWGMPRVARACAGPVRVLSLPYDAPGASADTHRGTRAGGIINILTIGHANPNKRIESVIRAIGSSAALRDAVSYRLCGSIDAQAALALSALARSLNVELLISGVTDQEALQNALNEADIVCCLRWPSLEAASASAVEAMLYGKAVIVTDTGFYSELPDDCVRKISPVNESIELRAALTFLCASADERQALGRSARAWAAHTFSGDGYAIQLLQLAQSAVTAAPRIHMARKLIKQLEHWGATTDLLAASRLAEALDLFSSTDSSQSPAQQSQQQ